MEMLVGFDQSIQDFPISNDVAYIDFKDVRRLDVTYLRPDLSKVV